MYSFGELQTQQINDEKLHETSENSTTNDVGTALGLLPNNNIYMPLAPMNALISPQSCVATTTYTVGSCSGLMTMTNPNQHHVDDLRRLITCDHQHASSTPRNIGMQQQLYDHSNVSGQGDMQHVQQSQSLTLGMLQPELVHAAFADRSLWDWSAISKDYGNGN